MIAEFLGYGIVSAALGAVFYANLPTRFTLGNVAPTASYLADTYLKKISSEKKVLSAPEIKASDLFEQSPLLVMAVRRPGCAFCRRQADALSNMSSELAEKGVRLIGVLHETRGADEFRPFLNADIYYDAKKRFFGPKERWMPLWMGFLRVSSYLNGGKTHAQGFTGNFVGEGRLLGGIYLINRDKVLYAHLEQEWGDMANLSEIFEALKLIKV